VTDREMVDDPWSLVEKFGDELEALTQLVEKAEA
jgi:hypothetical protein